MPSTDEIRKNAPNIIAAMITDNPNMFNKQEDEFIEPHKPILSGNKLLTEAKKKSWPKKLKKGRFTTWCKKQGFKGPCKACAKKAMKSKSSSVRGMASFYMNTTLKNPKTKG